MRFGAVSRPLRGVHPVMMQCTQPRHVERPRIVGVVTMDVLRGPAHRAGPLDELPIAERVANGGMSSIGIGVVKAPLIGHSTDTRLHFWPLCAHSIVSLNSRIGAAALYNLRSPALLALTHKPVAS